MKLENKSQNLSKR